MKKLNFLVLMLMGIVGSSASLNAQHIKGVAKDATGKAQEFATVMLLKAQDSSLVKGAVTDFDGKFDIENTEAGRYFVQISMVGLKNFNSPVFEHDGKSDFTVENIALQSLDQELAAVTVTARKPMIEVKADRTVFNVENTANATGLNALELLRRSPGVQVDKDENIQLRGKSNVLVYINGKPSQMSGRDLAAFLKGLNSSDIESIEIIANPGAKFDAEGNAGIVNIKLKKNKKLGTNGNVSIGFNQGITPKADGSVSLNYRDKKFNAFGSYNHSQGRFYNLMELKTRTGDTLYYQRADQYWYDKSNNFKLGADYFVDSKNTVGFIVNGGYATPHWKGYGTTPISRVSTGKVDSVLRANSSSVMENLNLNYNVNYRYADTSGRELNIDADYGTFRNKSEAYVPNIYTDADATRPTSTNIFRNSTPVNIDIRTAKADYEQPLWKGKFGAGVKYSDVKTDNTFNFYNVVKTGDKEESILSKDRSNNFTYTEKVAAAYVNFNRQFGKYGVQLGVRGERTHSIGNLTAFKQTKNANVDTTYFNVFPSAALSYNISDKHALNFTYRYSIDRPDYRDLNPFENPLDELTFEKGNPFIRPQYTNTVELGYTFRQMATASINYAHTEGFFTQVTDREFDPISGKDRLFITKRNIATRENYGLNISSPLPINKWWSGFLNLWGNYSINKADFGGDKKVNLSALGGGFYMQHTFQFGKGWSAEVNGWMNFGGTWGLFVNSTQGMMNAAVQKKFWDGDATIRLGFDDVFKTAYWRAYQTLGPSFRMDGYGTWEGQQVKVNFSYRFGNKQVQGSRQRKTGLEDEKNRVKSGKS